MIRNIEKTDIAQVCEIYNHHLLNGPMTFDTEPISVENYAKIVDDVCKTFPFFVYEEDSSKEVKNHTQFTQNVFINYDFLLLYSRDFRIFSSLLVLLKN